jgi:hypothetical protein
MNKHDKNIQDRLEAMPFTEARKTVRSGTLHTIGSPDHDVALSWLEGKEAEIRDLHNTEMISITRASKSKKLYEKPLSIILMGVIGSLLAAFLWHYYFQP